MGGKGDIQVSSPVISKMIPVVGSYSKLSTFSTINQFTVSPKAFILCLQGAMKAGK